MGRHRRGTAVPTFFATTDPLGPYGCMYPTARYREAIGLPDPGHDGLNILRAAEACDLGDGQGFCILRVESPDFLVRAQESLRAISKRCQQDDYWILMVVLVGSMPCREAVPDELKSKFYPVDLTDHVAKRSGWGVSPEFPRDVASDASLQELFRSVEARLEVEQLPLTAEQLGWVRGLELQEFNRAMMVSVLDATLAGAEAQPTSSAVDLMNPSTIEAIKHRWAWVP
jgi:hypothetical protein